MEADARLCVAYIAGRLITGKNIACLYDYIQCRYIDIARIPHAERLREFCSAYRRPVSALSGKGRYRYSCNNGHFIDVTVNGNTFIGHISGSFSHFVGNVRGDFIYLYDEEESAHFNFKISGCLVEQGNSNGVCHNCSLMNGFGR